MRHATITILTAALVAFVVATAVLLAGLELTGAGGSNARPAWNERRAPSEAAPDAAPTDGAPAEAAPREDRGEMRALVAANEKLRAEVVASRRRVEGLAADLAEVRRVASAAASDASEAVRHVDRPVVGSWTHSVDGRPGGRLNLADDGTIRDESNEEHGKWRRVGASLQLVWPNGSAPGGGEWVDSCMIAPDGKSYLGTNQVGSVIRGRLFEQ
jgi:hypothetical protein